MRPRASDPEFAEAIDREQRNLRHLSEWELPESVRDVMGRASGFLPDGAIVASTGKGIEPDARLP